LRCAPPYWAGVRFSLLANPMTFTGLSTMSNWIIERAGLFDFRLPVLSPALQVFLKNIFKIIFYRLIGIIIHFIG
jgi:hypothetical protein